MTVLTANDAIRVARGELGTKEYPAGSNRQKYGAWYGWNGVYWCVEFASWVIVGQCHVVLPGATTSKGFASCVAIRDAAHRYGRWVAAKDLRRGDLVLQQHDADPEPDHVEIFDRWTDTTRTVAVCIGGNTSPDDHGSQSNGGMVCEKNRPISCIQGGYRPPYAPPAHRVLHLTSPQLHGTDVADVAKYLNAHGFPCGTPIDVFGPQMDKATRGFQHAKGLTVNGRFGAPERHAAGLPA